MTIQPSQDDWEYKFVGDIKPGDIVRVCGKVTKVETGSVTNTIYFEGNNIRVRTWHQFHSLEVKKEL